MNRNWAFLLLLMLPGALLPMNALDLRRAAWLPPGTEIVELRTANARHYSNGDGTIRAVLEARGGEVDERANLSASYSGYSELMYVYGSLFYAVKHSDTFFTGYFGDYYPDGYIVERAYVQWDISSIPDSSIVNRIRCSTYCNGVTGTIDSLKLFDMRLQPSVVSSAVNLYNDAGDPPLYGYYRRDGVTGWYDTLLNANAISRMQRHLNKKDTNWFAIGYSGYPTIAGYNTWELEFNGWNQGNPPKLIVDYTPPGPANDVGVSRLLTPNGQTIDSSGVGSTITPACSVFNYGTNTVTYTVRMKLGNSYNEQVTVSGHAPNTARYVTFPSNGTIWPRGTNAISCSTELTNDEQRSNDKQTGSFTIRVRDVGVTRIVAPVDTVDSGFVLTPACSVYNYGTVTENPNIRMRIGTLYTALNGISLAPGTAAYVTFPEWTASPSGALAVRCSTEMSGDMVPANNRRTDTVYVRSVQTHDVGVFRLIAPIGQLDSGTVVTPACSVFNYGTSPESYSVRMKIGASYDEVVSVSNHPAGSARSVTFPDWIAQVRGTSAISCSTQLAGDAQPGNDKVTSSVSVLVHDIAAQVILAPSDTLPPGIVTPRAVVRNDGNIRDANVFVTFTIDCSPPYEQTLNLTNGLPVGADTALEFPDWTATAGSFNARCSTYLAVDQNPTNDVVSSSFVVESPAVIDIAVTAILAPVGIIDTGALVAPRARFKNLGENPASFLAYFTIRDSAGTSVYFESTAVANLPAGESIAQYFTVWPPPHSAGNYATHCQAVIAGDVNPENDTLSGSFVVRSGARPNPGWYRMADVPTGPKSKRVKDGGCLTGVPETEPVASGIYCLKGNNTCEFYLYNIADNLWTTRESIPAFGRSGKKKAVKKGGALTQIAGKVYAFKGNGTLEFWCYDPNSDGYPWSQLTDVPEGSKTIKEGAGACGVMIDGSPYIYLLKGSNTGEFYRYNTATGNWETRTSAPAGVSGKFFKNGSCITFNGANTIYALKANYNELFAYDIAGNTWLQKTSLPMIGSSGKKKKVKDGAGIAAVDEAQVYALKGGNTLEFWYYLADSDKWWQKEEMPTGGGKKVKAGGALTWCPQGMVTDALWALKGNNTFEFYVYIPPEGAIATDSPYSGVFDRPIRPTIKPDLQTAIAPLLNSALISYNLPMAGSISLKLYDITGKLVMTLAKGYHNAGSYTLTVGEHHRSFRRGVYLLKLETENGSATRKLIIQ